MYAVTPKFLASLTTSHQMVVKVDAYFDGELTVPNLPITDGSVTVDRGSKVRRSLSLTVGDVAYLPWDATDPLAVYGQELRVQRGIRFPDGSEELVPLGQFRINEPSGDVHTGPVTLTGQSAESAVIDDIFMVPTSTRGYGSCVQAIEFLIRQTLPDAPIVNLTSDSRNPVCPVATWDVGGDRWDAVVQVATAMRAQIFVDAIGRFVLMDLPDPLTSPVVWDIAEGEGGTLVSASRQMSRTGVCNAVVVSAENSSSTAAPVSAVAYDDDPSSPTRWGGPFGRAPKSYTSPFVTTLGDAQAIANYMIADLTAPNIQTSIATIPNPALESGDCIRVSYAGRKELFIANSFSVPLTAEGDFPITLQGGKEEPS
ncbi:DUF5047 domain-containing protein [Streptomyces scabiei]|uniref:DUF5047 domain-containing protein n=1 Tax=Streptomyces scabiei TaxID=1930 RepID=UPI0029AE8DC7|nr:DUF5047 domain-containing protein [Streptomyces scabiei]MDX2575899.1 DUF5047 domain-containing protein [Streptomyces scabiei]MDX2885628.1 DUF5047 domain-containing protein [Streptomyces scabiei]MDX2993419.1 DUF5047 domain-containing protein [Streptomyces scabiei]MDX3028467.1 DUF5047 domain-containing protein [Streptomyces scabiei]MDX3047199.1 DUF5047 domain-containing protein [Streptomyces scabiei]